MPDLQPFVDIHCHLAPTIDDGAKSWDDTLAMARIAVSEGIGTIVCTPHQCGSFSHNTAETIRQLVAEVQKQLNENAIPLRVFPGADVRIEPNLVAMLRRGEVLTLADRGRHVLLELPHEVYLPLDHLLDELHSAKIVGILSHPERNEGILARPTLVPPLVEAGCLMQVTAGSLMGAFGAPVQQSAENLVQQGLVHFISTDAHSPKSRRPLMRQAFDRCAQLVGKEAATSMFCTNPAAVAEGGDVTRGRMPVSARSKASSAFGGWFGRRQTA
jgi:protein-tyrosine phosphatase